MRKRFALAAAILAVLLPGHEAQAESYLLRSFTWFGFIDGADIRRGCVPGAPDRLRFIYNGHWHEQVRVYEYAERYIGWPGAVTARILTKPDFSNFTPDELVFGSPEPTSIVELPPPGAAAFKSALVADGFLDPVPGDLALPSFGFHWVAVGCLGGRFKANGWLFPGERFERLTFPQRLLALDRTGVPFNPPRPVSVEERMRFRSGNFSTGRTMFEIRLEDGGVKGRIAPF